MEKLNLKKVHSLAKVIGTGITVSGAMLMTLYKGPIVDILWYSHGGDHHKAAVAATEQNWATGTIMLLFCIMGWSTFFIVQVHIFAIFYILHFCLLTRHFVNFYLSSLRIRHWRSIQQSCR